MRTNPLTRAAAVVESTRKSYDDFAHQGTKIGCQKKHNALSCSEGEPQAMSTGVQSLLDDVTVEGNPESSDDFAINNARHITYRGDDIADSFLNQFKIHSEFDRDNIKHAVTTKVGGSSSL